MPLLLCPNDNSAMRTVQRAGVEFDMCPTCRGVWLDRGELEKLMATARADDMPAPAPGPAPGHKSGHAGFLPQTPPAADRRYERRDADDDEDRAYHGRGKKRGSSFFDIFD